MLHDFCHNGRQGRRGRMRVEYNATAYDRIVSNANITSLENLG